MKAKPIYWVMPKDKYKQIHEDKIHLLRDNLVIPKVLDSFESFFESYNHRRTSTVIIGDEFGEVDMFQGLIDINQHPELAATRFILSLSELDPDLVRKATLMGFRDVIPLDLADSVWIDRFNFSCSGTPQKFRQPLPQMTLRNISAVKVPARLAWISDTQLWIESKIKVQPGAKFKLTGGISDYFNSKGISLTVVEHRTQNLRYRFSDGYICEWSVPNDLLNKKRALLENLGDKNESAPHKAYVAISTYRIRHSLIQRLDSPRISINVALHKNSIAEEAKFLNPDVVFIEDSIAQKNSEGMFYELLRNLNEGTPVYILGRDIDEDYYRSFEERWNQQFIFMRKFNPNFRDIVLRKLEKSPDRNEINEAHYINHEHPLSFAEVSLSARLLKIHPESMELAVSHQVSNYGLIGIDSSITKKTAGRTVHGKVTASYHHDNPDIQDFPYIIDCYLSDLLSYERSHLADYLITIFKDQLSKQIINHEYKHVEKEEELTAIPKKVVKAKDPTAIEDLEMEAPPADFEAEAEAEKKAPKKPRRKIKKSLDEQFVAFFKRYGRDLIILVLVAALFTGVFVAVFYGRKPASEQGKVYSDQLLKFQQRFQNDN